MVNYRNKFTKNDLLKLKIRREIYQYISKNPGLHFRELIRRLNIPLSTLRYHLNYLEKQELIIIKKDDKFIRYFISKNIGEKEKRLINVIRIKTTRDVLLYIMFMVIASKIEIAKELDKHTTTIDFHLKRLMKNDILEPAPIEGEIIYTTLSNIPIINRKKSKNEIFYRIKEPHIIEKLLIIYYKKGYYNDIISEAIFSYSSEVFANVPPKKIRTTKYIIEQLEKNVYNIFPHPYYA